MTFLENIFTPQLINALGLTLIHSLWQGLFITVIAGGAMLLLHNYAAKIKYILLTGALFALLASVGFTFVHQYQQVAVPIAATLPIDDALTNGINPVQEVVAKNANYAATIALIQENWQGITTYMRPYFPLLVIGWLLGMFFFAVRFVGGLLYIQQLKTHRLNKPVSPIWQQKMQQLTHTIAIGKSVQLVESVLVQVPMVIGWLKPMILLPIGALNGLTTVQVEAILAHELAHIKRHDYFINMLQSIAEIVLFFHPAAWWLSAKIREEREHCCDDIAVAAIGSKLHYAKALTAIEGISLTQKPYLATAFSGNGNHLMQRIKRLFQPQTREVSLREGSLATATILVLLLGFSWTSKANLVDKEQFMKNPIVQMAINHPIVEEMTELKKRLAPTFAFNNNAPTDSTKKYRKKSKHKDILLPDVPTPPTPPSPPSLPTEPSIKNLPEIFLPPLPPMGLFEVTPPLPPLPPLPDVDYTDDASLFYVDPFKQYGDVNWEDIADGTTWNDLMGDYNFEFSDSLPFLFDEEAIANAYIFPEHLDKLHFKNSKKLFKDSKKLFKGSKGAYWELPSQHWTDFLEDEAIYPNALFGDSIPEAYKEKLDSLMRETDKIMEEYEATLQPLVDSIQKERHKMEQELHQEWELRQEENKARWERQQERIHEQQQKSQEQRAKQMERLHENMEREREQMERARERAEEMRERHEDKRIEMQEKIREKHEKAMEKHQKEVEKHHKEMEKHHQKIEAEHKKQEAKENAFNEELLQSLQDDGLLKKNEKANIDISKKKMILNGERMSDEMHQKYLHILENRYRVIGTLYLNTAKINLKYKTK